MAQFHFVEDYERLVNRLIAENPIDDAMAMAVGGAFEAIGRIEVDVLKYAGLRNGMAILDMGCGSGRLPSALGQSDLQVDYLGVDIVPALLDYAATKSPLGYRFLCHRALSVPAAAESLDFISGFSIFTHLLHHETYLYLQDMHRVLRPGAKLVFSFLEFSAESHWGIFLATVEAARTATSPHLNSFIERNAIEIWATKLGFIVEGYIEATQAVSPVGPLGQSVVVLQRR